MSLGSLGPEIRWSVVLAVLSGALIARADYRQSYTDGLKARDEKKWSDVALHMAAAIAERPAEGDQYLPYYHLGLAHAELGNCAAAVAAWNESERQGAIRRNPPLYEKMRERTSGCGGVLGAGTPGSVQGVPPILVEGAAAYFQGDYERVTSVLSSIVIESAKLAAQQHLFLAAAEYARYLLDGKGDESARSRAVEHVRRCRRFDPELLPPPDIFSPRFVAFFNEAR